MDDFKGYTHIVLSVASVSLISGLLFPFDTIPLRWHLFAGTGAVVADIDHPFSLLGKYNIGAYAMKHRGFTHTIPGLLFFSLLVYIFYPAMGFLFGFGYLTHLVGDYTTPSGIMWLYPFKNKKYSLRLEGIEMLVFGISLLYLWKK